MKLALSVLSALYLSMAHEVPASVEPRFVVTVESHGFRWLGDTSQLPDHIKAARILILSNAHNGNLEAFKQAIRTIEPQYLCFDSPKWGMYAARDPYDAIFMHLYDRGHSEESKQFAVEAIKAMWEVGAPAQCPEGFLVSRILKAGLGYDLALEAFDRHFHGEYHLMGHSAFMNMTEVSQEDKIAFFKRYMETEQGMNFRKDPMLFEGLLSVLDLKSLEAIDFLAEVVAKGAWITRHSMQSFALKYFGAEPEELRFFEAFFNLIPVEKLMLAEKAVKVSLKNFGELTDEGEDSLMAKYGARANTLLKIINQRRN